MLYTSRQTSIHPEETTNGSKRRQNTNKPEYEFNTLGTLPREGAEVTVQLTLYGNTYLFTYKIDNICLILLYTIH